MSEKIAYPVRCGNHTEQRTH